MYKNCINMVLVFLSIITWVVAAPDTLATRSINVDDAEAEKKSLCETPACAQTDLVEKNGDKDLKDILKSLGGWPVLEGQSWNETIFDWKKIVYKLGKMGHNDNIFVSLNVFMDQANSNVFVIYMDQATTEILPKYVVKDTFHKFVPAYFDFMIDAASYLGADMKVAERELIDVMNFEIQLRRSPKMSLTKEERRNTFKLNNRMTLQQLQANFTGIPWKEYINEILAPIQNIADSEEVVVLVPSFLQKLPELIAKTPKRVLANYALWRVVRESIGSMGERASSIESDFERKTHGKRKSPRWKKCLEATKQLFDAALGRLYVSRYFEANAKTKVEGMVENVQDGLLQVVEQAEWIDAETKRAASDKVQSMKRYVAYPDEILNDDKLNEYYKNLKVYPESYLKTLYSLRRFKREQQFASLRKSYEEVKWVVHSDITSVNAFNDIMGNTINIEAGILQGHFYNVDIPNYMNYGAIGWVIGHEMTHALDDKGSQFDKNGNLVNWWKNETGEEYLKKANCTIQLANNYVLERTKEKLNGAAMQGETIADHGGLKAAYKAYQQFALNNAPESRLPGLDYTPEQMFWISAGHIWCEKMRPEIATQFPGDFRVFAAMSHLDEFSKDFDCPSGSFMNPVDKCSVW